MTTIVEWVLSALGIYLALGFLFAVAFACGGARKIDPSAAEGTWGFRILIIPGSAIFWPYLLKRWVNGSPPPEERSAHRRQGGERNTQTKPGRD